MINFRLSAYHPHYGDDVEPYLAVDMAIFDVVVDGLTEALQLTVIDGFFGSAEESVATGLYLDKHHFVAVSGDDVDIPTPRFPVAFNDPIAVALQKFGGLFFTPSS